MTQYTPQNYAQMLSDPVRGPAFTRALAELITSESIVLDLGAGTGGLTLLACNLGAKKVIAIEPNPAIQIAKELIQENGFEKLVEFYDEPIEKLNFLPVDLIIADLRGKLPFYQNNLPTMQLAYDKFLKPSGALLPSKDKIYLALSADQDLFQNLILPLNKLSPNLATKSYQKYLVNHIYPVGIKTTQLASAPELWCSLDYTKITDFSYGTSVIFNHTQKKLFGFFAWFDCELTSNVRYTCGPDSNSLVYGSVFFPFEEEVIITPNQQLEVELSAKYLETDYLWRWKTTLIDLEKKSKTLLFDQSTVYGTIFSPKLLAQKALQEV